MIEYLRREEVPVVDGMIQVPSWRPDLRVMADIAEEVARYYGYNNIETTLMRGATTMGGYSDAQKLENAAGAAARAMGYSEIITYSVVSPASFDAIRIPADSPLRRTVKLVNPLGEDTSIMRTVILPSMLDILSLAISTGCTLTLLARGDDAREALTALADYLENLQD